MSRDALAAAIRREHAPEMSDADVRMWANLGWTADLFVAVENLASWTVAHRVGILVDLGIRETWDPDRKRRATVRGLTSTTAILLGRGADTGLAFAWTEVEAGAPDAAAVGDLQRMLDGRKGGRRGWIGDWEMAGALGPLAWAAGLTASEAFERNDTGAADAADLVTLAALRGWLFPPAS